MNGPNPNSDPRGDSDQPTDATNPAQNRGTVPDPFDLDSLRLSPDMNASLGVKKKLVTVPVRKPSKEWFIRVHPDESYRLPTAVIELKEDREIYLVAQDLWPSLAAESTFSPRMLFTAINRQNVLFLWQVRLPGPDGKIDEWSRSAMEAAQLATEKWVRVQANMSLGAYDICYADAETLPEPEWPVMRFSEIVRTAFKDKLICALDHPVLRKLRGEA